MPINTSTDYVEIGTSVVNNSELKNAIKLPAPINFSFSGEFMADANRNASGTMVFRQVGRTQYKTEFEWGKMENRTWWELNRWFEKYGYVFYMKYFDHMTGKVKIHRFYRGSLKNATPSYEQETIGGYSVPKFYSHAGFSVIDMGEFNVKTVATL